MTEPQSNLFQDPQSLVSDLNEFARCFPVHGPVADLAVKRLVEILQLKEVGQARGGGKRPPRNREIIAATRVVAQMARINQQERDSIAGLMGMGPQIATAVQVNIDTQRASEKDEALNDLVARTAAESRAILDAYGPGHAGDVGSEPTDHDGPGGNGNGRPEQSA